MNVDNYIMYSFVPLGHGRLKVGVAGGCTMGVASLYNPCIILYHLGMAGGK